MEVPRGFTRCDECEGSGSAARWPMKGGDIRYSRTLCPSCSGSGLVPTEKLREEAAAVLWESWWDYKREPWHLALTKRHPDVLDIYRETADAVLRKVAEHIREGR